MKRIFTKATNKGKIQNIKKTRDKSSSLKKVNYIFKAAVIIQVEGSTEQKENSA